MYVVESKQEKFRVLRDVGLWRAGCATGPTCAANALRATSQRAPDHIGSAGDTSPASLRLKSSLYRVCYDLRGWRERRGIWTVPRVSRQSRAPGVHAAGLCACAPVVRVSMRQQTPICVENKRLSYDFDVTLLDNVTWRAKTHETAGQDPLPTSPTTAGR